MEALATTKWLEAVMGDERERERERGGHNENEEGEEGVRVLIFVSLLPTINPSVQ